MPSELKLEDISAGYGPTVVLENVSLAISQGASLAVLGRNGVGKSTLLDTMMGHTTLHHGLIMLDGQDVSRMPIHDRARKGVGYVPQERLIFPSLTVVQNLTIAARTGLWGLKEIFELFPQLGERRGNYGNQLSGGEQQMLSVARTLMTNPKFLLLDEPLEGLAPILVETLMSAFEKLRSVDDLGIVLVEQHMKKALEFAEHAVVLDRGRIAFQGTSRELLDNSDRLTELIGLSSASADDGP